MAEAETSINVSEKLEQLIQDIAQRVPKLKHVLGLDIPCLVRLPRKGTRGGKAVAGIYISYPKVYRRDALRTVPYLVDGVECRYFIVLNPRMLLMQPPERRLETVIHELWHIHPEADGRKRRVKHGKTYDEQVAILVRQYLKRAPEEEYQWLFSLGSEETVLAKRFISAPKRRPLCPVPWSEYVARNNFTEWGKALISLGCVRIEEAVLSLDSVAIVPKYEYRCESGHAVRVWVKFRRNMICTICLKESGVRLPFTLVE